MSRLYYLVYAVVILLFMAASVGRGFLVNSADALRAASAQGFSQATITQELRILPGFAGCDGGDAAGFHMTGINSKGDKVTFTACSGWPFKGITIRY